MPVNMSNTIAEAWVDIHKIYLEREKGATTP